MSGRDYSKELDEQDMEELQKWTNALFPYPPHLIPRYGEYKESRLKITEPTKAMKAAIKVVEEAK